MNLLLEIEVNEVEYATLLRAIKFASLTRHLSKAERQTLESLDGKIRLAEQVGREIDSLVD